MLQAILRIQQCEIRKKCLLATCLIVHMYCIYMLLFYKLQFRQFTMFSVGYPLILVAIITTYVSSRIQGCWKVTERLNCVTVLLIIQEDKKLTYLIWSLQDLTLLRTPCEMGLAHTKSVNNLKCKQRLIRTSF